MNEKIMEFFELKYKQLLAQVMRKKHFNIAYTGDNIGEMLEDVKYRSLVEDVEKELIEFVEANMDILDAEELQELAKTYKVSSERQKELSKELVGEEYTIDDLVEIMETF